MNIYKKSVLRLINSYGYSTQDYPFVDLIHADDYFYSILVDLINKNEIIRLNGTKNYASKDMFLRYELIKNSHCNLSARNQMAFRNLKNSIVQPNIIFDLGGVIADESDLDVFICDYFNHNVDWRNFEWDNYFQYSQHLENELDPKWYDYYAQGDQLGIDLKTINRLHHDNIDLVHFFEGSIEFIKELFRKGHKIFFMTGCNSKILQLRLKIYGIDNYISGFVTSDLSNEIGNKENYFNIFFQNFKLPPSECLLITDNFIKDGLPAISFGVKTLLFISGGRNNTNYNSHGLKPHDLLSISLLIENGTNSPLAIFDSFNDLRGLF